MRAAAINSMSAADEGQSRGIIVQVRPHAIRFQYSRIDNCGEKLVFFFFFKHTFSTLDPGIFQKY